LGNASAVKPVLPPEVKQFFVPARAASGDGVTYRPVLFGAADVQFLDPKRSVDETRKVCVIAPMSDGPTAVNWDEAAHADCEAGELEAEPLAGAGYSPLPAAATKAKSYTVWNREFGNWVFANETFDLFYCASQDAMSGQGESERDFRARLQLLARERRDADMDAVRRQFEPKFAALEQKIRKAEQTLAKQKEQASSAKWQSVLSIGGGLLGAVFGSRRGGLASQMGKAASAAGRVGRIRSESQDVDFAEENLEQLTQEKAALEQELQKQLDELSQPVDFSKEPLETVSIRPKKTNIAVRLCALAWVAE
jgi:hypothetical protein